MKLVLLHEDFVRLGDAAHSTGINMGSLRRLIDRLEPVYGDKLVKRDNLTHLGAKRRATQSGTRGGSPWTDWPGRRLVNIGLLRDILSKTDFHLGNYSKHPDIKSITGVDDFGVMQIADEFGMSGSTVRRLIDKFEPIYGEKLVTRSPGGRRQINRLLFKSLAYNVRDVNRPDPRKKILEKHSASIIHAYEKGESLLKIANKFQVDKENIRRLLIRHGIKIRRTPYG